MLKYPNKKEVDFLIFEQDNLVFQVLDVIKINQGHNRSTNPHRNFDALSFRFRADTAIELRGEVKTFSDNSVAFVPSNISYTRTSSHDDMIVIHFKALNYNSTTIESYYPSNPEVLSALFVKAYECWNKKDIAYRHETTSIVNLIFAKIYKDNCYAKENTSKIGEAIKYINRNIYSNTLSLTEAARIAFMSNTYFRKLFKREYGISPKEYVIERRIKYASSLILSGNCTLKEVATHTGYNDYKHFSVEFKRITGKSPSEYSYNYYLISSGEPIT